MFLHIFFMIWILFGIQINTFKRVSNIRIDLTMWIEFNSQGSKQLICLTPFSLYFGCIFSPFVYGHPFVALKPFNFLIEDIIYILILASESFIVVSKFFLKLLDIKLRVKLVRRWQLLHNQIRYRFYNNWNQRYQTKKKVSSKKILTNHEGL